MRDHIPVGEDVDAVLTALALHTRLGRGRVLELAIARLAEAVAAGDQQALAQIAAKRASRPTPDVSQDDIELDWLANPASANYPPL